jgi:Tat protein translocase TatB subunit
MSTPLAFLSGSPGWGELLLVFAVVLVLFGPRRLPELARMIGKALEELRRASQDFRNEVMRIDTDVKDTVRDAVHADEPEDDSWNTMDADFEDDPHGATDESGNLDDGMYGESAEGPENEAYPVIVPSEEVLDEVLAEDAAESAARDAVEPSEATASKEPISPTEHKDDLAG